MFIRSCVLLADMASETSAVYCATSALMLVPKAAMRAENFEGQAAMSLSYSPCVPIQNQCTPSSRGNPSAR